MQTLGDYLKKTREAQNISLSDVADYTKISKTYLDCLENNEFKKIPAKAYVKGYISSYAACLGIDQHEALKRYDSFQNETGDAEEFASEIRQDKKSSTPYFPRPNKKTGIALAVGVLIMLSIGLYYSFFHDQKKAVAVNNLEEQPKTTNPTLITTVAYDLPPKNQDKTSFQSGKQAGFEKTIEARAVRTKQNDGMSQKSDPPKIQQLQPKSKDAAPDQPITEFSRVKELSGSGTDPIHDENNLKIIEAAACSSVKDRTPQGPGHSFEWSMDRIFIWNRIQCERPPASIRHIYFFKGEKVSDILLNIRSSPWRTWSYKTLSNKRYIGPWRVDIASIDGKLLQSINFEIN